MDNVDRSSNVAEFYRNRTILITGGTGFMGKVLVEKLLRSCSGIKRIYLLVRWKKGSEPQERLHQLFESKLFDRLKKEQPHFSKQVICISGNLELENLGVQDKEYAKLIEEVSIIFHMGAGVKFNENLKKIVNCNVCGTKRIIDLAKEIKTLEAFLHVSTAYCNTHEKDIYERVYPTEFPVKNVIDCLSWMSDEMVEAMRPVLLSRHPNNYCYSKCLTEQLLAEEAGSLPVVIVRPTNVSATFKEPIEGWIDSYNGTTLGYIAICKGLGRVIYNVTKMADFIPVDICINLMVASAWSVSRDARPGKLVVYNCSTSTANVAYSKQRIDNFRKLPNVYPSLKAYRYPHLTVSSNVVSYEVNNFLEHFLPAVVIDVYLYITGKKPRMLTHYRKFKTIEKAMRYFYCQEWKFYSNNAEHLFESMSDVDKQIFDFNVRNIDWEKFGNNFAFHAREYLLKEDPSTLPLAKKHLQRLYYKEMGIRILVVGVLVCCLPNDVWCMISSCSCSISSAFLQIATSISSWIK